MHLGNHSLLLILPFYTHSLVPLSFFYLFIFTKALDIFCLLFREALFQIPDRSFAGKHPPDYTQSHLEAATYDIPQSDLAEQLR